MTREEVLRLKAAAEAAQQAADTAAADAAANPTDATKAAAAVAADLNATKAWKAWKTAEKELPPVSPADWRVISLGVYLALMLFLSVYLLSLMTRAEPPEKATGELLENCCGADGKNCPSTPTPTSTPANTNTNSPDNSNAVSGNTVNANTNQANSNLTSNSSANQTVNSNGNLNQPANGTPSRSTPNVTPTPTPSPTPAANANSNTSTQNLAEITIPPVVCVERLGRLSADGFLFLIVLFAGMVGAVTRGVFSFIRHHGVGDFSFSWTWFYLFLPFSGAVVSLFLYFIIRGGFYGSPIGKGLILNLFAFVALGTLSGLFAENAMEKLRAVAEVLLAKVPAKVENPKETSKKEKPAE
jgi:hypothetical protein